MKQIEEQERNKNCSRTETPMPETSGTIGQVHYKYNQGFSNAVKKPVRMMDLLNWRMKLKFYLAPAPFFPDSTPDFVFLNF